MNCQSLEPVTWKFCTSRWKIGLLPSAEPVDIRQRVEQARVLQAERLAPLKKENMLVNGDMEPAEVQEFCQVDEEGKGLMRSAMQQMNLSARAYHRVLKLSRTIADLAGEGEIRVEHLAEALQYRPRGLM